MSFFFPNDAHGASSLIATAQARAQSSRAPSRASVSRSIQYTPLPTQNTPLPTVYSRSPSTSMIQTPAMMIAAGSFGQPSYAMRSQRGTMRATACSACGVGYYSTGIGDYFCEQCAAGTSTEGTGSSSAASCTVAATATFIARLRNYVLQNRNTTPYTDITLAPALPSTTAPAPVFDAIKGIVTLANQQSLTVATPGIGTALNGGYTVNVWARFNNHNAEYHQMFGVGTSATNSALGLSGSKVDIYIGGATYSVPAADDGSIAITTTTAWRPGVNTTVRFAVGGVDHYGYVSAVGTAATAPAPYTFTVKPSSPLLPFDWTTVPTVTDTAGITKPVTTNVYYTVNHTITANVPASSSGTTSTFVTAAGSLRPLVGRVLIGAVGTATVLARVVSVSGSDLVTFNVEPVNSTYKPFNWGAAPASAVTLTVVTEYSLWRLAQLWYYRDLYIHTSDAVATIETLDARPYGALWPDWHMYTVTWSPASTTTAPAAGKRQIFMDGVKVGEDAPATPPAFTDANFYIGAYVNTPSGASVQSQFSDFRAWTRQIAPTDIVSLLRQTRPDAVVDDVASTANAYMKVLPTSSAALNLNGTDIPFVNVVTAVSPTYVVGTATTTGTVAITGGNALVIPNSPTLTALATAFKSAYTVNIWCASSNYSLNNFDIFGFGTSAKYCAVGLKCWSTAAGKWHPHFMWYYYDLSSADVPDHISTVDSLNADGGKMHMYTVTWSLANGGQRKVFFDGVRVICNVPRQAPLFDTGAPQLFLGKFVNSNSNASVVNTIGGFRIWTSELSDAQVVKLFSEGAQ